MRNALAILGLVAVSCGSASSEIEPANQDTTIVDSTATDAAATQPTATTVTPATTGPAPNDGPVTSEGLPIPPAPVTPTGPTSEALAADLDEMVTAFEGRIIDSDAVARVAEHGDARTAWLLTDLLRFARPGEIADGIVIAFQSVTGVELNPATLGGQWKGSIDYLIAWDLPALEDYADYKSRLYQAIEPAWEPFFTDENADVDWRFVSWGGVFIDDRPLGVQDGCPRGCIPALDDPVVTDAAGGAWLDDDRIVFGVTLNGESRAYPKHQMETHEMVNDTLGGRRIGIPYCTLCGSAQAFLTDSVPDSFEVPVLRTSGLLSRSNKVMFDLTTFSLFDTFTGAALSGPLQGVTLDQVSVVASTWGAWREAHPQTTIVAQDGGLGFQYLLDPLRGRDDNGPIFPVGDVDDRLGVSEVVIGVEVGDGTVIAFPKRLAADLLGRGEAVSLGDVSLILDGTGLLAHGPDGAELVAHEAFWFAWSQFWPETLLWTAES